MNCVTCNCVIPAARLEILPHTTTCVKCSSEKPYVSFMVFEHKTGGYPVHIRAEQSESVRLAKRAFQRSR
jgi:hypothetical protein